VNGQIPDGAGFVGVVNSTNITVKDLRLTNNYQGVLFAYSKNSRIVNVTTLNNDYGIYLLSSINNTLQNNIVSDNWYHGICLLSSINNTLQKNNVSNNIDGGIYLLSSINNTLQNNIVSDNWYYGIYIHKSNYNNISNNIVKDNYRNWGYDGRAIYIYSHSEHNTITDNTIEHNTYGIIIDGDSGNNTAHTNVVKDNQNGVYVTARYNLIYNNYILSNKNYDAKDTTGDNRWNITKTSGINILGGSYLGGNYYSEYTGSDEDGDGLGDTPFIIADKDTKDHHPLVSTILVSERWNSKTGDSYTQSGDILWKVTDQTDRENPSCDGATQTYSWSDPGTKYVDVWLTNEENGTSNKTEWVVIMSTDVKGQVKDNSNNPLISNITYYDTDGETALDNITSSTFNFTGVPLHKRKEH
jgi:parallel beta-helix repeat protein